MLKRAAIILGVLVALVVAATAGGWGFLQTGAGKAWLGRIIAVAVAGPGEHATVTGLDGTPPFALRAATISIADERGTFLTVEDAHVVIAPASLLAGRVDVTTLSAASVDYERPSVAPSKSTGPLYKGPPLPVSIQRIAVSALTLDDGLVGKRAVLSVDASLALGKHDVSVDAALKRIDGTPGDAKFHLALAGERLDIAVDAREPTGAVLQAKLHAAQPLPLEASIKRSGTLDDWRGDVGLTAGPDAGFTAHLTIAGAAPHRVTLDGTLRGAALLPPALQPLAAGGASIATTFSFDDKSATVDRLTLSGPTGKFDASGRYTKADDAVSGHATLAVADLAPLSALAGQALSGAGTLDLKVAGTLEKPQADATLAVQHFAAPQGRFLAAQVDLSLNPTGNPQTEPVALTASGRVEGLELAGRALPAALGQRLQWSMAGTLDAQQRSFAAKTILLATPDASLSGAATITPQNIGGAATLWLAEIGDLDGGALKGRLDLSTDFRATLDGAATATLAGTLADAQSSVAQANAALGDKVALKATLARQADGTIAATDVSVAAAHTSLTGAAKRASDGALSLDATVAVPDAAAIDPRVKGAATVTATLAGMPDALRGSVVLDAPALDAAGVKVAALKANLALSALEPFAGHLDLKAQIAGLDTAAATDAAMKDGAIRLTKLSASAGGARIVGAATVSGGVLDGTLTGKVPDLSRFSALAGTKLAGSVTLDARGAKGRYDIAINGANLAAAGTTIHQARLTASIANPTARPTGRAEITVSEIVRVGFTLAAAHLNATSLAAGRFGFDGGVKGREGEPYALDAKGELGVNNGAYDLKLASLSGTLAGTKVMLAKPLAASLRGDAITVSGLALGVGAGRIDGDAALDPRTVKINVTAKSLPVQALARLGGHTASGTLAFSIAVTGSPKAPQGAIAINGQDLRLGIDVQPDIPAVGLTLTATLKNGRIDGQTRLTGPQGMAISGVGSAPLAFTPTGGVAIARDGALSLQLQGGGELAAISELLPLGEDRATGKVSVQIRVDGTVAAPVASGELAIANGQYESLATGAELKGLNLTLVGDRNRLVIKSFAANDGGSGTLGVGGSIDLASAAGLSFDIHAKLAHFHALQRDEATAAASGTLDLTGSVAAPAVKAAITIDQADVYIPDPKPQSASPVNAVIIDSANGGSLTPTQGNAAQAPPAPPIVAATLDITVDMPGRVFVRGRGLDSEWRGKIAITGTSQALVLSGKLFVVRGTFDFIGKSFVLSDGTIVFWGNSPIDPTLAIDATGQSSALTALIAIGGTASHPTIKLSSQPPYPRDEILSQLLFGSSMRDLSAAQGLQLAAAAASLSGGQSLDVLGSLRKGLGLDRLSIGNAPSSVVPGANTSGQSAYNSTAVNAGKYIANGVYVGVSQGASMGSSKVTVETNVTRHITVDAEAGASTGTGLGLSWKLDY